MTRDNLLSAKIYFIMDGQFIEDFIMNFINLFPDNLETFYFDGNSYRSSDFGKIFNKDIFLNHSRSITFGSTDDDQVVIITGDEKLMSIKINSILLTQNRKLEFIENIIKMNSKHFIIAYIFDDYFDACQNETDPSNYEFMLGKLPDNVVFDSSGNPFYIDISKNPGRHEQFNGITFMSAWQIYFSIDNCKKINLEIFDSDNFHFKKDIFEKKIFLFQLYNNPFMSLEKENLNALQFGRNLLGLDI